jgi:Ser/Thr protein kinase RdoA (MazF antagonist)
VSSEPLLAHGLGKEPAAPEWPPLTENETAEVLSRFGLVAERISWRSPRPWSAAALVRTSSGAVFVKRHHFRVRSQTDLTVEHEFLEHLRQGGIAVPDVLAQSAGDTALSLGQWVYEVHAVAEGADLYRDALSWTPYQSSSHAAAAGEALARLHLVAASYSAPVRPGPPLLCSSARLLASADFPAALDQWLANRPATARYLAERGGRPRILSPVGELAGRVAEIWPSLPSSWAHHDWHGSNLLWTPSGEVRGVIDVGLADRTGPAFDLATAIERSMIGWLNLTDDPPGAPDVRDDQIAALLDGYQRVRPLLEAERLALPMLLPVVHVELALSEMEYYVGVRDDISSADLAYEGYLLGHLAFFDGPNGRKMLAALGDMLG